MARNGSGTYSLPAGNPVVSGDVIASDWANDTMDDIADEITGSLSRNGQGGMLADLEMTGFDISNIGALEADDLTLTARGSSTASGSMIGSRDLIVRMKDADETVTGSTALQADNDLSVDLEGGAYQYAVEAYLRVVPSTTGGFKMAFVNDEAITSGRLFIQDHVNAAVEQNSTATYTSVGNGSGVVFIVHVIGFIITDVVPLVMTIQWAQQNAAGNTKLAEGSWVKYTKQVV